MKRNLLKVLVMAFSLSFFLSACGGAEEVGTKSDENTKGITKLSYDELVEKAKEEGKVLVYGSSSPERMASMINAFEGQFGIKIQFTRLVAGELANRVDAEHKSKKVQVDVILNPNTLILGDFKKKEYLTQVNYVIPKTADEANSISDGYFTPIQVSPSGIMYDSSLMEKPTSWEDLLDPEVDQFAFPDPAFDDSFIGVLVNLRKNYGDEFIQKLGKKLKIYEQLPTAVNSVMGKEIIAGLSYSSVTLPLIDGNSTSIEFTDELEATAGPILYQVLVSDGPNNHAGLLFMNWSLSPEGQSVLNGKNIGVSPLKSVDIKGVRKVPNGFEAIDYQSAIDQKEDILELINSK
jgi:iron(III) transport system substrate-binding protein